jgi:hypothetical protein
LAAIAIGAKARTPAAVAASPSICGKRIAHATKDEVFWKTVLAMIAYLSADILTGDRRICGHDDPVCWFEHRQGREVEQ